MDDDYDHDDDRRWMELLGGRAAPEALGRTRHEAAWLRAALLTWRAVPPVGSVPDPAARVSRLVARAVDAGVLPAPARTTPWTVRLGRTVSDWTGRLAGWPGLAAAAVLVMAVVLWPLDRPAPGGGEDTVLRGGPPMVSVETTDPAAEQARYRAELEAAGVQARPATRPGRLVLDVEVPAEPTTDQLAAFERLRLGRPQAPALVIEFHAP